MVTTEQQVINTFWPDDDLKTIEDLINVFTAIDMTREAAIDTIKDFDIFSNVTDWSI